MTEQRSLPFLSYLTPSGRLFAFALLTFDPEVGKLQG